MRYRNQLKVSLGKHICSSLTSQHCAENVVALLHIAPIIIGENENKAVCKHQQLLKV